MSERRLISKDKLIAFIKENGYVYANTLETFPEEDVAPVRHGEWIKHDDGSVTCSVCRRRLSGAVFGYPYSACCGARMDGMK